MNFRIAKNDGLAVKLEADESDVDIVVTLANGEEYTVAYLNNDGLTICSGLPRGQGIDLGTEGCIQYQED